MFSIKPGKTRVRWEISPPESAYKCSMFLIPEGESVDNSSNSVYLASPDLGNAESGTSELKIGAVNNGRNKLKPGRYFIFVMSENCTWAVWIEQQ